MVTNRRWNICAGVPYTAFLNQYFVREFAYEEPQHLFHHKISCSKLCEHLIYYENGNNATCEIY